MKINKKDFFTHVMNVVTVALIVESFLCAMLLVNKYGRENCFVRIEESTEQMSQMFVHSMEENQNKLTVFAGILASNSSNSDEMLEVYMQNFCSTQDFDAVCIHRANGTAISHGNHPHDQVVLPSFYAELNRLPYVSDVYKAGNLPNEQFVYQAVPVVRNGETIAVLYGYISLDAFSDFISASAYGGSARFSIVNGDSGDFLMNEPHDSLGNLYEGSMQHKKIKEGYSLEKMQEDIKSGHSGYFVFGLENTRDWFYTYYLPIGINNWSIQMTIDEATAFASYHDVNHMMVVLAACVIFLMVAHVLVLMEHERRNTKKDRDNLHKSNYINEVQRALINAHNAPGFLGQALKIIADEMQAETVLLLAVSGLTITHAYYWPSTDKAQAMEMVGKNVREEFPVVFDLISANQCVIYDEKDPSVALSESAKRVFTDLRASNLILVPIMDNAGIMKGVIAAVNSTLEEKSCEMLECVTYDLFMSLSNQESYEIIQRMGTMDYLTKVKNRNSFEAEVGEYAAAECACLWCGFIDVNGLHEVNNTLGHKAGDIMLCAVADAVKRVFGEQRTYRFGGDEFVVFAMDGTEKDMLSRRHRIEQELAAKGHYVSIGFGCVEKNPYGVFEVDRLISEAEAIMYQEKWNYYKKNNISTERGNFPKSVKISESGMK